MEEKKEMIDEIIVSTNQRKNDTNKLLNIIDNLNMQKKKNFKNKNRGGKNNVDKK